MELNFKKFGSAEQNLVILHGLFGSLDNWQSIAQILSSDFTVYIVDQRNHGKSPHLKEHNYHLMASDLKQFFEAQGIKKAHLLGHSMGGKTAMQFAVDYPYLLNQLVVIDISPRYYAPHHQEILAALNSVDFTQVTTRKDVEEQLSEKIKEPMVLQFLLKGLTYEAPNVLKWKFSLDTLNREIENIGEALDENAYCSLPTLFIKGENSNYIKPSDETLIEQIFPQAEIVTVSNAGHWLHAENQQEFLRIIRGFLK